MPQVRAIDPLVTKIWCINLAHYAKNQVFFKNPKLGQNSKFQKLLKNPPGECCNEATLKKL